MTTGGWRRDRPPRDAAGDRSAGEQVEPRLRGAVERSAGRPLDHVRLHDDVDAQRFVDGEGALGVALGGDIALGSSAREGLVRDAVVLHELAHAAQQADLGGAVQEVPTAVDAAIEADADRIAVAAALGARAPVRRGGPLGLRRCDDKPPPKVQAAAAKADPAAVAGFEKMVRGGVPASDAAEKMQLPKELTDAMAEAWSNSFPGGHSKEQGGLLVKKSDGTLDWVKATRSTSGSTTMPYDAVPSGATPIVAAHTHPYDTGEGGHKGVMFSGGDLGNLVTDPISGKVVHAGDRYFAISKTKAFDDAVAAAPDKAALKAQISSQWDTLYRGASGDIPARARAATTEIAKKYNLVLYEGTLGGEVTKVATK